MSIEPSTTPLPVKACGRPPRPSCTSVAWIHSDRVSSSISPRGRASIRATRASAAIGRNCRTGTIAMCMSPTCVRLLLSYCRKTASASAVMRTNTHTSDGCTRALAVRAFLRISSWPADNCLSQGESLEKPRCAEAIETTAHANARVIRSLFMRVVPFIVQR